MKLRLAKGGEEMSYWQCVFSRSVVNGAHYRDNELPLATWNWPKNTFLQRRLSRGEPWGASEAKLRDARGAVA